MATRGRNPALLIMVLSGVSSACGHVPEQHASTPPGQLAAPAAPSWPGKARTGEYIVTLAAGADAKALQDTYGHLGIKSIKSLGGGVFQLTVSTDPGLEHMEKLKRNDARIEAVQPNFPYRTNRPTWPVQ